MTIEDLEQTLEWNACTVKQRMWIRSFIASNGNALLATKQAYDSGTDLYAQMFSHQVRSNGHVRAVLNLYFGISERARFIDQLQKRIEAGTMTIADWKSARLLCTLRGWAAPESPTEEAAESENSETQYHVGQIVSQNGFDYRVVAADANGKILKAEPVAEVR
jgi:hypothetical protein